MLRTRVTPLLGVFLLVAGTPAISQVTVDLHALQALPERAGPAPMPRRVAPTPRPAPSAEAPSRPAPTVSATAPQAVQPAPQPALPTNIPSEASIAPVAPSAEAIPPPPPPTVTEAAPTKVQPESQGLRVLFGEGSSDLNPDSMASLKQLAGSASQNDGTTFNVSAFAAGSRDDPSTARRLSLARAMAVRSALVGSGVPSNRVYVRALGDAYGSGPADRADISVTGANAGTAQAAPK